MTEGCRSATKYCDVYAGLTRYRDLRKPYDLPVLPVPLFEHELYGVGLFALAAGDVHDRLRHRFVERIARFERHFLHAERGKYGVEILIILSMPALVASSFAESSA